MYRLKVIKETQVYNLIGWMLAFIGGLAVFRMVDNMQTTISRHEVIKDIENCINQLFSNNIAIIRKVTKKHKVLNIFKSNKEEVSTNKDDFVSIRTVLHDKTPWGIYCEGDKFSYITRDKKYIKIREYNDEEEFISTQALHEILIIFRRIEKLYKDRILKDVDLADLWRELMPFGVHGRLEFLESYFGQEDVQVIAFVIFNTLVACEKYKVNKAINYFLKYYIQNSQVHTYFYENSRFGFKERFKRNKFRKIVYK